MKHCKNCNQGINGKFCSHCGYPAELKRIDSHYLSHEIQHLLHFEKGFFFTVKELMLRPGKAVREFISVDRNRYVKPIVFLIFTAVIFTLITHYFHIEYSYFNINKIEGLKDKVSTGALGEWLNKNIGYTNLIMGVFIAFWIKILFKKHGYNLYEITVLLCFVLGEATLILSIAIILINLTQNLVVGILLISVFFLYIIWAIGQFFGEKKFINYFKALLTFVLGNLSYLGILIIIGLLMKTLSN